MHKACKEARDSSKILLQGLQTSALITIHSGMVQGSHCFKTLVCTPNSLCAKKALPCQNPGAPCYGNLLGGPKNSAMPITG